MKKTITVVDKDGTIYESTYPKRAKGLMKKGRARFIDENTICLACPPYIESEDHMTDHTTMNNAADCCNSAPDNSPALTMEYLLKKIDEIASNQEFLLNAISELGKVQSAGPGDTGTQEKAKAIAEIVKAREATNQRLLAFYEKMYGTLNPKASINEERFTLLSSIIENAQKKIPPKDYQQALVSIMNLALSDMRKEKIES
ncbi:MAG: hypothetical protein E7335_06730 [Clostridiales bacterium]|nr:hypothetical protein [Clostridiales bacterium]